MLASHYSATNEIRIPYTFCRSNSDSLIMEWSNDAVKAFREYLGKTQAEFAEMLGYSEKGAQVRVSEIERGKIGVSGPLGKLLDCLAEKHKYKVQ